MGKRLCWKATLSLILITQSAFGAEMQVNTLSEGACWYEYKEELLRVASFNDKSAYSAHRDQIQAEVEELVAHSFEKTDRPKITDLNLALHCGGYGASLVAKVVTETNTLCLWTKFEKGKLGLRSIGAQKDTGKNSNELCDGHKWGELIVGVSTAEFYSELQNSKWSTIIKEVKPVTEKVVKIVLVKEYEFREQEVIDLLQENFSGKNIIRYIEFNDYRHPIGEYTHLR